MKGRLQLRQRLDRGVLARTLVGIERECLDRRLGAVRKSDAHRQRDDLVLEVPALDRGERALMAAQRELILRLTGDAGRAGVVLGDEAGAEVHVGVAGDELGVGRDLVAAHRHHAHRLGAAGDRGAALAEHDALGAVGDRLQPGGAEAIDRHRRGFDGNPGTQARDPRDVHALFAFRHRAPDDHIVDQRGIQLRHALECALDGGGAEFVGTHHAEGATRRLADGGSDCGNDDGVLHVQVLAG